jgi:rubrerythrin
MALLTGDEIIEIAMRLEERGEEFYRAAADRATTGSVHSLFTDLAKQEVQHRLAFARLGRDVVELALSPEQWDEFQSYTNALLEQSLFAKPEGALAQAAQAMDEREAVQAALGFEKETLLFFHELRDAVRGVGKQVVSQIIDEERRHIQRLSTVLSVQ